MPLAPQDKPTPPETPAALQAFEDYWAMGDGRTLPALAQLYSDRSRSGEAVPTHHLSQLKAWSSAHGWQERCKQRIAEEAAEFRAAIRQRTLAHRKRLLAAIEADSARYVKRLQNTPGELMAEDALSLERLTKLYFQLAEEPLADRHEVTGAEGGPLTVQVQVVPAEVCTHEQDGDGDTLGEAGALPGE